MPATITATSTLASNTNHYAAWQPFVSKADDDRMWCEGKPDDGIGEALVVAFASPVKLHALELSAGVWKSEALFRANNVVAAIDVTTDDGRKLALAFPDERKPVEIKLGGAPVKQLRFAIGKVKKGKMNDSCISSVKLTFASPGALLVGAERAPALGKAVAELRDLLSDCNEAKLGTRLRFPFTNKPPNSEGEKPKYKTYANLKDLIKACKKRELWGSRPSDPARSRSGVIPTRGSSCSTAACGGSRPSRTTASDLVGRRYACSELSCESNGPCSMSRRHV